MTWGLRRLSKRSSSTSIGQTNGDQPDGDPSTPAQNIKHASTFNFGTSKRNTYDESVHSARRLRSPTTSILNEPASDDAQFLSASVSRGSFSKESRKSISKNKDKFGRDCRTDRNMASAAVHKMLHGKEDHANERDFVAQFGDADNLQILKPEEITEGAREKGLGQSSKMLKKDDFEFMRTLGTGVLAVCEGMKQLTLWQVHLREYGWSGSRIPSQRTRIRYLH